MSTGFLVPRRPHVTQIRYDSPGSARSDRVDGLENGSRRAFNRHRSHGKRISSFTETVERHGSCDESIAERIGSFAETVERHGSRDKSVAERIGAFTETVERHPGSAAAIK